MLRKIIALRALALLRSLILIACSLSLLLTSAVSASATESTASAHITTEHIQPLITTAELVVGHNRFAFGLSHNSQLIDRAKVKVRIYSLAGHEAIQTAAVNAPFQAIATVTGKANIHRHADGSRHGHSEDAAVRGST